MMPVMNSFPRQWSHYWYLMRFDKPIGIWLLLWPTLWALWLAGGGHPPLKIVMVFISGVVLMRAAGCIMSDIADREFDKAVRRTCERPIASGKVSLREAFLLLAILSSAALGLVLFTCHIRTILLAIVGFVIAAIYPLLKRVTYFPQVGLGVAFTWGIPMAFMEIQGEIPWQAWLLFAAGLCWPIIFDTFYALVDREDDLAIGVKSTAVLWGERDLLSIAVLQGIFIIVMGWIGWLFHLNIFYGVALGAAAILFIRQLYLAKDRDREQCFKAFTNNNWVGFLIFIGMVASL